MLIGGGLNRDDTRLRPNAEAQKPGASQPKDAFGFWTNAAVHSGEG